MDILHAFQNKLLITQEPIDTEGNENRIKVTWLCPTRLNTQNVQIGLYAHKREMNKNYITYFKPKDDIKEYYFEGVYPKGYYDIRVCSFTLSFSGFNYTNEYQISKYFVGYQSDKEFEIKVSRSPEALELLVQLSSPAEEGDFIGMFEEDSHSMKDSYMVGITNSQFGEGNLERYFEINLSTLSNYVQGKKYQVRYFKNGCDLRNKADVSRIPFAFSEPFEL